MSLRVWQQQTYDIYATSNTDFVAQDVQQRQPNGVISLVQIPAGWTALLWIGTPTRRWPFPGEEHAPREGKAEYTQQT